MRDKEIKRLADRIERLEKFILGSKDNSCKPRIDKCQCGEPILTTDRDYPICGYCHAEMDRDAQEAFAAKFVPVTQEKN